MFVAKIKKEFSYVIAFSSIRKQDELLKECKKKKKGFSREAESPVWGSRKHSNAGNSVLGVTHPAASQEVPRSFVVTAADERSIASDQGAPSVWDIRQ